jgi:hypothetical protein
MTSFQNPAVAALLEQADAEFSFGQARLRRTGARVTLRHAADAKADDARLFPQTAEQLRVLAQTTESGAFRPLKTAPDLRRGWLWTGDATGLDAALEALYPGALADWFAARRGAAATGYREFTARQTGMYRLAAMVEDALAADITRAGCSAAFCVRRRLWAAPGAEPEGAEGKSVIPCLEPCALLLEFARASARAAQGEKAACAFTPSDLATLSAALDVAQEASGRAADFSSPLNPRRVTLLRTRLPQGKDAAE